jgi:hypothetical protein
MHDLVLVAGFFALGLAPCLLTLRVTDEERLLRKKDRDSISQLRA